MVESGSNSHDAYFRHVMARPDNAASELRAVLPSEIGARIDCPSLELQPGSFVTSQLRCRYSDLLYRTRIDDHPAFIYLLIEHQSRSDRLMPFRMLEYIVAIWRRHLEQNQHSRKQQSTT
ncbi:Rpn family recombination-promoting nuclease/putative transposase [Nocardia sp. NPDC059180]|uniref:Rpn family recombination-promoting nuclease/putative transposase n=1 Tax=Nocardia sp. NPDC059180 TaxID=3346761 RepID=UPI0036A8AD2D